MSLLRQSQDIFDTVTLTDDYTDNSDEIRVVNQIFIHLEKSYTMGAEEEGEP